MRIELEDFKTGWYGVSLGLKKKDIEVMIESLKALSSQETGQHFHLGSNYGVGDLEIYLDTDNAPDNVSITGFAKGETT